MMHELPDEVIVLIKRVGDRLEELPGVYRLSQALEKDRADVAIALANIREVIGRWRHLSEGRGSFHWDDDRWKKEFAYATAAIETAIEKLAPIARNWTDCPKTQAEVDVARRTDPLDLPDGWSNGGRKRGTV